MSKAALSLIQSGLRDLGHDPGPVDGFWGPRTQAALRAALEAQGAPPQREGQSRAPILLQGRDLHPVREIVVHCSATRPDWMAGAGPAAQLAEIRRWHLARDWHDIGYHWLIGRCGTVLPGRPETVIGAHVEGRNPGSIGVCLVGGHGSSATDAFWRHFTPAQDAALRSLVAAIRGRADIRRVSGHNEHAAKACPGFDVVQWLKEARA